MKQKSVTVLFETFTKNTVKTIGGWQRGKVGKKEVQAGHFINVIESFEQPALYLSYINVWLCFLHS